MKTSTLQFKLKRQVDALNELMDDVRETYPNAEYYLSNDTLNLMSGPSHDGEGKPRRDRILAAVTLIGSGGGDW